MAKSGTWASEWTPLHTIDPVTGEAFNKGEFMSEEVEGEWKEHGDSLGVDVVLAVTEALAAACFYPAAKLAKGRKAVHQSEFEYYGEERPDGTKVRVTTKIYVELVP